MFVSFCEEDFMDFQNVSLSFKLFMLKNKHCGVYFVVCITVDFSLSFH